VAAVEGDVKIVS